MADTTTSSAPVETTSGATTGGSTGQGVTLEQLMAQVAALAGAVQTTAQQVASVSAATQAFQTQIADGMKSLTENVNKLSDQSESDTGFTARWAGAANPLDDQFRNATSRDHVGAAMQQMTVNMVERVTALMDSYLKYTDGVWARSLDHFGALPPIAPRSATGPGTSAA